MATAWKATHELTFTPADGGAKQRFQLMIMPDRAHPGDFLGYTREEWPGDSACWHCSNRVWTWLGMPGPDGGRGAITLRGLDRTDTSPSGMKVIFGDDKRTQH